MFFKMFLLQDHWHGGFVTQFYKPLVSIKICTSFVIVNFYILIIGTQTISVKMRNDMCGSQVRLSVIISLFSTSYV